MTSPFAPYFSRQLPDPYFLAHPSPKSHQPSPISCMHKKCTFPSLLRWKEIRMSIVGSMEWVSVCAVAFFICTSDNIFNSVNIILLTVSTFGTILSPQSLLLTEPERLHLVWKWWISKIILFMKVALPWPAGLHLRAAGH